ELQHTTELLSNWATDPKEVKQCFINNPACPEFPDSEWNNIILGKPINLNAVFSGMFTTQLDEQHKEKFGDLKITCGVYTLLFKTILTGQDWHTAWVCIACAY
ncbi:hypothetical protein PAXRUDRAFT_140773, partial [Paxillus rubicundulus Ve08.2h10]